MPLNSVPVWGTIVTTQRPQHEAETQKGQGVTTKRDDNGAIF